MNDRSALEPLFSSAEMRAVEEAYPGYPDSMRELMVRAGTAVAEATLRRFPGAKSFSFVCGGGSNGGDGLVAADALRSSGREVRVVEAKSAEAELGEPDVVVDALFGTGFSGTPRNDAAALIERMNSLGRRSSRSISPPASTPRRRDRRTGGQRRRDGHLPRAQGRARRCARPLSAW